MFFKEIKNCKLAFMKFSCKKVFGWLQVFLPFGRKGGGVEIKPKYFDHFCGFKEAAMLFKVSIGVILNRNCSSILVPTAM